MPPKAPKPLTVLHGDAEILKRRVLQKIVSEHVGASDDVDAITEYWGKEVDLREVGNAVGAVSLFSDRRVILLREFQAIPLREQKPLEGPLANIPEDTRVVILTRPRESDRDSRKPPVSAPILKLADTQVFTTPWKAQDMLPWITDEFRGCGKRLSPSTANLLLSIVGPDYDRLHNEIQKLVLYAGEGTEVTDDYVRECACPAEENTVFELTDAIGARDVPKALSIVRTLLPKEARRGTAIPLLAMIARQLRLLWQAVYTVRQLRKMPDALPPELMAIFPDQQGLSAELSKDRSRRALASQARNFNEGQLAKAMLKVYEADLALKGYADEQLDDRMVIETLVISLCRM
ncbi:MAG: DNA polymerase III subunit delta [Armatimonadota bacterium]